MWPCSPKSTSTPGWLMGSLPTRFGWLGIRGLLSELSIPWNREQTDSLTQGIIEAGPRYQETENPAMRRVFLCPPVGRSMSAIRPKAAIRLNLSKRSANDPKRTLQSSIPPLSIFQDLATPYQGLYSPDVGNSKYCAGG